MLNVILKENEISAEPKVNVSSNFEILERELKVNTKMSGNCFRRLVPVKVGIC